MVGTELHWLHPFCPRRSCRCHSWQCYLRFWRPRYRRKGSQRLGCFQDLKSVLSAYFFPVDVLIIWIHRPAVVHVPKYGTVAQWTIRPCNGINWHESVRCWRGIIFAFKIRRSKHYACFGNECVNTWIILSKSSTLSFPRKHQISRG